MYRYEQYKHTTQLKLYSKLNHKDIRKNYISRSKCIVYWYGNITWNDKNSANYYSVKYLW
jgi:hypothetical protein